MTAFATLDDYDVAFPGSLDNAEDNAQATAALAAACEDIRRYCHQQISLVEHDEITVDGSGRTKLLLPELPIVAVNTVTIDKGLATELAITDFRINRDGVLYRPPICPDPLPDWDAFADCCDPWFSLMSGWPIGFANITVDYDHGYTDIPPNLIQVAVQLARDAMLGLSAKLRGEHIGGYSYTRYEGYEGVDEFSDVLDRYKINRVPAA